MGMHAMSLPRVAFIDDEPHVLEALRRSLRGHQNAWDMSFHVSPVEALETQKQHGFDVAVVDMRMPEMNGLELIQAMAAVNPSTVAIVLTGTAELETAIAAINEADVFRFYTKPCEAAVLAAGIGQALAQRGSKPAAGIRLAEVDFGVATLNRLPTAVVVVDRQARALFMNRAGAALLAGNDGLTLGPTGICRASRQAETADLHSLIKAAVAEGDSGGVRAVSLSREKADRSLSVVVAPLPAPEGETAAVLLINDPDHQTLPSAETVVRLFELTDAEARLALSLTEGHRIEEAAEMLGITVSSARTYLKRIFAKTGITRQAELIRLVLAAPTLLDDAPPKD